MIIILPVIFLFLAIGIYLLLCSVMHLPSLSNTFSMLRLTQNTEKRETTFESLVLSLATGLSKYIRLNPDRRETMVAVLRSADMDITPETYYAKVIVRFLLKLIPAVIFYFFNPIASLVFLFWAIWKLFDNLREARQRMTGKSGGLKLSCPGLFPIFQKS